MDDCAAKHKQQIACRKETDRRAHDRLIQQKRHFMVRASQAAQHGSGPEMAAAFAEIPGRTSKVKAGASTDSKCWKATGEQV